ncbi:Metalloenzyme, LuxS/M16 peptidase-like protein [Mycena floridula]|nr:Metalloenzyme, LuxS/M16 peptidase-like protein [Mycena floridula]
MSQPQESFHNFDLVKRFKLHYTDVTISKWKSRVTGLSVVHLDYDAPIVNGYFTVATEIFNDSGCPHTLEHLVFMGSEKYPYKGIIDMICNRGFSNGTNAWTACDVSFSPHLIANLLIRVLQHTAYTVSTAGEQGFLQLLPIYVDHILYPTMTKAGFVTEVHHIDPQGQDSGVVYSEMQGRENTSGDLMSVCLQRALYPPSSAYRSETGGLMSAIRVLTVEQIREYHASYYVPHNLSLIVAGKLSSGTTSLLSVVQEQVEPSLIAHGQNQGPRPSGWKRPFVETPSAIPPPLSSSLTQTVEFPEQDETMGELIINFDGPAPNAFLERKALDIIGTYLTSSTAAPLNKEYIETDSPLCTYIYFSEDTRANKVSLPIYIGSVPTEHLEDFATMFKGSLTRIVAEGIDMERMSMVINRDERQLRSKLESTKGDTFSDTVISDFLYGAEDGSELEASMDEINQYAELRKWTSKDWTDLLQRYYISPQSAVIIGKPSARLAEKLEADEKARIAAQVKELGPQGLAQAAKDLEAAKAEHDKLIPTEVLTQFPIPSVESISWIPVDSAQEPGNGRSSNGPQKDSALWKHIRQDGPDVPFFVQYDHVSSDFVTVHALFSLANVPDRLRPHVSTYLSTFFALPVKRQSGEHLGHEQVINKLDDETVSYEAGLGISGSFAETLRVTIKVETAAYETAIAWLKDLVYGAEFTKDRLQVIIAKAQQALVEMKRDGDTVKSAAWMDLIYDETSTSRAGGILPQIEFIPKLALELQANPESVVADFEAIRKSMTEPSGIRFSVTGDVLKLSNPRSAWAKYFDFLPETSLGPIPLACDALNDVGKNPVQKAIVLSLPTIESSYTIHTTKGIQGFDHPLYPAFRVALEVLNATESYLWKYIRGSGLAYGAYVSLDLEAGLINFSLYRSSNCITAFQAASDVIKGLVDGSVELETTTLDAAKSSIVYAITKSVSTAGRVAVVSFTNQALKGVPQNHHVNILEKCQQVTKEDVMSILQKYFLPLFDSSSSVSVVATAPGKADEVAEGLSKFGFDVEKRTLEVDPEELEDGDSESESGSSER